MENIFVEALNGLENTAFTENGRPAYRNTKNAVLDFFYRAASLRKANHHVNYLLKDKGKGRKAVATLYKANSSRKYISRGRNPEENLSRARMNLEVLREPEAPYDDETAFAVKDLEKSRFKDLTTYMYYTVSNEEAFESSEARQTAVQLFFDAFAENRILAILILFWLRDARGGAGERQTFRSVYRAAMKHPKAGPLLREVAEFIPEYGRWDDLWNCLDPFDEANGNLAAVLQDGMANPEKSPLLAKWLPRENKKKLQLVKKLAALMGYRTLREYRKDIASKSQSVVERKMSANAWDEIMFDHVPSVAMMRYSNAFSEKAGEQFTLYKEKLGTGEAKINASVLFPYDVIQMLDISEEIAEAAWKALPEYIPAGMHIFPMVDVSGSMYDAIKKGVSCMDAAVSLGMYCAERQSGPYKNLLLTFSERPSILNLANMGKTLKEKVSSLQNASWGMNTNIDAAMRLLLEIAVKTGCPQSDMPDILYILSDMQFDAATYSRDISSTFLQDWVKAFEDAGYVMPHVVFHNLNGKYGNAPALADMRNVSMVSGFSPSIMRHVLAGEEVTPEDQMYEVLYSSRYAPVREKLKSILYAA